MSEEFNDLPIDLGSDSSARDWAAFTDVPHHLDRLPDGTETLVFGDPEGCKEFNHIQGNNDLKYGSDCGLVACQDVLGEFGISVTESDVVHHAVAHGECDVVQDHPDQSGTTTVQDKADILTDYGIPARSETGISLEDLASEVEHGHGVIASVNAGYLWNDAGKIESGNHNHAITVTGVARDPHTNQIQGFFINDSGTGNSSEFVTAKTMEKAWLLHGVGVSVVTEANLPVHKPL
jgi:ribosome-binding protein aMBF1 (putative translation factor)